jgi:hypothetical protein
MKNKLRKAMILTAAPVLAIVNQACNNTSLGQRDSIITPPDKCVDEFNKYYGLSSLEKDVKIAIEDTVNGQPVTKEVNLAGVLKAIEKQELGTTDSLYGNQPDDNTDLVQVWSSIDKKINDCAKSKSTNRRLTPEETNQLNALKAYSMHIAATYNIEGVFDKVVRWEGLVDKIQEVQTGISYSKLAADLPSQLADDETDRKEMFNKIDSERKKALDKIKSHYLRSDAFDRHKPDDILVDGIFPYLALLNKYANQKGANGDPLLNEDTRYGLMRNFHRDIVSIESSDEVKKEKDGTGMYTAKFIFAMFAPTSVYNFLATDPSYSDTCGYGPKDTLAEAVLKLSGGSNIDKIRDWKIAAYKGDARGLCYAGDSSDATQYWVADSVGTAGYGLGAIFQLNNGGGSKNRGTNTGINNNSQKQGPNQNVNLPVTGGRTGRVR